MNELITRRDNLYKKYKQTEVLYAYSADRPGRRGHWCLNVKNIAIYFVGVCIIRGKMFRNWRNDNILLYYFIKTIEK